jgi:predicted nucleotidyltransferase
LGWTAIGEAQPDSDVDLFFDYEKGALGLFPLVEGEGARTHILARKADIMTRDSLRKPLRRRIEATAVPIF